MMRFSTTGHFAVALLILTGIANIAMTSGAPPFPPSTPYRALLLVKILLVAIMVGIALFNRYILAPRLGREDSAQAILRATCLGELALGAIVVGLVSVFGLLDPH
jgi:putative copper resistance protein D